MPDTQVLTDEPDDLVVAAGLLRAGELVAFPTETVYGLGANALDPEAVAGIFAAKDRPADNPLIVHLADPGQLDLVAVATPLARELAATHWPGPLTLVLDAAEAVPPITRGGHPTVAVRIPDHPTARRLLEAAGVPVAAPSANRSGRPSPTMAAHVLDDLGGRIAAVVDGGTCPVGVESTVVDARGSVPVVLRDGTITREQLGAVGPDREAAASPGARYRHYAPSCRVELAEPGTGPDVARALVAEGARVHLVASGAEPGVTSTVVADAGELASALYGALRAADVDGADVIVVETVEPTGIGRAVMDRLRRAAGMS